MNRKQVVINGFAKALLLALLVAQLGACSFKVETGWHGRTGRDDRVISPDVYSGASQARLNGQRY